MCVEASGQSDSLDKMTKFSRSAFPSSQRRGGCGINQKSRSHRRAADGVVAHATRFTNAFRSIACERPPRPCLFSERIHFANGASTPPLQGGECTYPKIGVKHEVGQHTS